jgi:hypothetical protein
VPAGPLVSHSLDGGGRSFGVSQGDLYLCDGTGIGVRGLGQAEELCDNVQRFLAVVQARQAGTEYAEAQRVRGVGLTQPRVLLRFGQAPSERSQRLMCPQTPPNNRWI